MRASSFAAILADSLATHESLVLFLFFLNIVAVYVASLHMCSRTIENDLKLYRTQYYNDAIFISMITYIYIYFFFV